MRRFNVGMLILVVLCSWAWGQTAPEFGQIWHKQNIDEPLIHNQGLPGTWNGGQEAWDWSLGHVLVDVDTFKLYVGASNGTTFSIGMWYSMNLDSGWVEYSNNPILTGTEGTWDAAHVGAPMVIKQGETYKMWYTGSAHQPRYGGTKSLGYATSLDGITWNKHPESVIVPDDILFPHVDVMWVRNPFVLAEVDRFKMWFGTSPSVAGSEDIAYATSENGIDWNVYSEPVIEPPSGKWTIPGCVKKISNRYWAWYVQGPYNAAGWEMKTHTAVSVDGIHWRKDALFNPVLDLGPLGNYDEDGACIMDVIEYEGSYWSLYGGWLRDGTGSDFGLAKYNPTIVPPGENFGTWTKAASPIRVQGEITIPDGETLTIEAGTTIEFLTHDPINIQGQILALGSEEEPIRFMVDDTLGYGSNAGSDGVWGGIRVDETPATNDSSLISYCNIRYAKTFAGDAGGLDGRVGGGIFISEVSKICIDNSIVEYNRVIGDVSGTASYGGGLAILNGSNPKIINNLIQHNTAVHLFNNIGAHGGGIMVGWNSSPLIQGNTIRNNRNSDVGAGIGIWGTGCEPLLKNNLIVENVSIGNNGSQGYGGGVGIGGNAHPVFINNTIANNRAGWKGGGFYSNGGDATFINTIIAYNILTDSPGAEGPEIGTYNMTGHSLDFHNSCLKGGVGGIDWEHPVPPVNDIVNFANSLSVDPQLTQSYALSFTTSQCIGAGTACCTIDSVTYNALPQDINGRACPDPPGSAPDMGAIESSYSAHAVTTAWNWWDRGENPVFSRGAPGTWDDVKVWSQDVLFFDGLYHMWYAGDSGSSYKIGYATSIDGINWRRYENNPVLSGNATAWYGTHLYLPRVLLVDDILHMWFFNWADKVAHATSADGINWEVTANPVLEGDVGTWDANMCAAVGVIHDGSQFTMWYLGGNADGRAVGVAYSSDGITWDKAAENPVFVPDENGWTSNLFYASSVVYNGAQYLMWYSGNDGTVASRSGRATSNDGIHWTNNSSSGPEIDAGESGSWNDLASFYPTVIIDQGQYKMWYNGVSTASGTDHWRIGYASMEPVDVESGYVEIPQRFMLSQNYPNPFNPMTHIRYALPENADIRLVIYDLLGREVVELVNDFRSVGNYETTWYGLDRHGNQVSTGVYFARLEAGRNVDVIKMLYLK